MIRSSSDRLGRRFFRWVCIVGVETEAGEGRGVGSRDWDEAEPSGGGPACVLALGGESGSEASRTVATWRSIARLPRFTMRGPLGDAEIASVLIPNRYTLLTDLADHATGLVLVLAYGGRQIALVHRGGTGWVARRLGRGEIALGTILRHTVSIFRRTEGGRLLKPGKRG